MIEDQVEPAIAAEIGERALLALGRPVAEILEEALQLEALGGAVDLARDEIVDRPAGALEEGGVLDAGREEGPLAQLRGDLLQRGRAELGRQELAHLTGIDRLLEGNGSAEDHAAIPSIALHLPGAVRFGPCNNSSRLGGTAT